MNIKCPKMNTMQNIPTRGVYIAYQEKIQNLIYLNVYPKWDPLRDDPRFQELIRRMNYPKSSEI